MAQEGAKFTRFTTQDVTDPERMTRKLNELLEQAERRISQLEGPLVAPREPAVGEEVYAVANVTEDRTFDADNTTLGEVADVLGTLLEDLVNEGKLR